MTDAAAAVSHFTGLHDDQHTSAPQQQQMSVLPSNVIPIDVARQRRFIVARSEHTVLLALRTDLSAASVRLDRAQTRVVERIGEVDARLASLAAR